MMKDAASTPIASEARATGKIVMAFGNLLQVKFEGHIRQGEVAMIQLENGELKGEVLEIAGNEAKVQVFEDSRNIKLGTPVRFVGDLLEAELGPGLLSRILDGLENPLEEIADYAGFYLPRGIYMAPLDRTRHWDFVPVAKVGQTVIRGDTLGTTLENRFHHKVMVPFSHFGKYKITWVIKQGSYPVDTVVAKAVDAQGVEHSFTMVQKWPIKIPLFEGEKVNPTKILDTGLRIIDTQFPQMKGGTFCTPGPFGAGKTVLQQHLSKYSSVDIVVVVACGERAGEVVEVLREFPHLIDPHTGETLMKRTVIICNTSSMPVAARESSVYMGTTIAEYYRQMGLDVLLLVDSTSRWAQAMREMSGRLEEIPGEEAFPAYLASRIAAFYERAGVVSLKSGQQGSLTICGAVSPAGGNFEEPVTQATLAVVGAFLGLSRERSDSRRYPSIDPLFSWSKYLDVVGGLLSQTMPEWADTVRRANRILREGDEIRKRMEVVGEEGIGIKDLIVFLKAELYDFSYLQQNAFDKEDAYCPLERQTALLELIRQIITSEFSFAGLDEARSFFLTLQNKVKNTNFMAFSSPSHGEAIADIQEMLKIHIDRPKEVA
jgi:V/A-type H+-transporting ATPase subunit A